MCWLLYYLGTTCSSVNYVNSADKTSHNCTYCSNNWFWLFSYLTLMSFPFGVGSLVGSFFYSWTHFLFQCPLSLKMRMPEERHFPYYTIESPTGVLFLGFFYVFFYYLCEAIKAKLHTHPLYRSSFWILCIKP